MPREYEKIKAEVGGDKAKASAIYISRAKTAQDRAKRAKLLRQYDSDEAVKAARKRGIIGTRG